ncbi:LLM class flavin-dependent oxidoreductase [Pseudomonas sp. LRF_L74]|uniref:LLM class flavin-dependent oxidoreductase n=1 Tax=Pseudomonas sp. LRF_L74 TaxID=3369422 RepID=UPI003F602CE4
MSSSSIQQLQLHLNVVIRGSGHHAGAWRHPQARPQDELSLGYYTELAQIAERGLFDAIFMADGFFGLSRRLEPFTLLSALAAVTRHIGLIATADTTYNEPFHLARKLASLDHISGGRAAWNVVTGAYSASQHFNRKEHPAIDERYRIGNEFLAIVKRLWDSWDEDLDYLDPQAPTQLAHSRPHAFRHAGSYHDVSGPLNIPRPPQGHPVIVQAGASEGGRDMAARSADMVFSAEQSLGTAQRFYADIKSRMQGYGRQPHELLIVPGFAPIVARSAAEAREIAEDFNARTHFTALLAQFSPWFNVDLAEYPLDHPVPLEHLAVEPPPTTGITSKRQSWLDAIREERMTIRQMLERSAGGHGFITVVGSPVQVADVMQRWLFEHAADGFNLMPHVFPAGLESFVDLVIPELQNRGIYRQAYAGDTLRDRLGLRRPERITG